MPDIQNGVVLENSGIYLTLFSLHDFISGKRLISDPGLRFEKIQDIALQSIAKILDKFIHRNGGFKV